MPIGIYERLPYHLHLLAEARKKVVRKKLSAETKAKISKANSRKLFYNCDMCKKECATKPSHFNKKKRHFCSMNCYSDFRKERLPFIEQNAYKGIRKEGESKQIYHRNYCKNHPENIAHLKARDYARRSGAEGSHSLQEWKELKDKFDNKCAICKELKFLTKDHIKPISKGGTDYISNIQPLCRNCNSKKHTKEIYIYENSDLLENKVDS